MPTFDGSPPRHCEEAKGQRGNLGRYGGRLPRGLKPPRNDELAKNGNRAYLNPSKNLSITFFRPALSNATST